jgi:hypothetical protein
MNAMPRSAMAIAGLTLGLATLLAGCDADPFELPSADLVVVRAYLYAGEPVTDVRLTGTLPLDATDSVAPPVNGASVTIIGGGRRYTLSLTPGDSGYYHYAGGDLTVAAGDVFDLEVLYQGQTITARTAVPAPPPSLALSAAEVTMPTLGQGRGGGPGGGLTNVQPLVVRWPNPDRELYFLTYQNVEPDPEPISGQRFRIRFISQPTAADSLTILPFELTHYGRHEVRLYRVNSEYAQLYASRQQDTRDLNEPATNIRGGLGVFTAFASRRAEFTLLPP